jgi:NTP pyrophosphatase (non-canonical NTP hydrolase)
MKENEIHRLLETAQANYGYANQVVVAIEELCELGAVLSKYPRYDFHDDAVKVLREKVLEETADVIIVLRHIQMIFGIQPTEIDDMMDKKLNRLKRWLEDEDKSFQHTTEDRAVGSRVQDCTGCYYWEHVDENAPCSNCHDYNLRTICKPGGEVT